MKTRIEQLLTLNEVRETEKICYEQGTTLETRRMSDISRSVDPRGSIWWERDSGVYGPENEDADFLIPLWNNANELLALASLFEPDDCICDVRSGRPGLYQHSHKCQMMRNIMTVLNLPAEALT